MFQIITQIVKNKLNKKTLSALLRRTTSKHYGDFYCLNWLDSFVTEKKGESDSLWKKFFLDC